MSRYALKTVSSIALIGICFGCSPDEKFGGSYSALELGIHLAEMRGEGAEEAKVVITAIAKSSPAEKAGLQANDIILQVREDAITSIQHFDNRLYYVWPTKPVPILVLRGSEKITIPFVSEPHLIKSALVKLVFPEPEKRMIRGRTTAFNLGIRLAEQQGDTIEGTQVVVTGLKPQSVAERAGFIEEDVIVGFCNETVHSIQQLDSLIFRAPDPYPVNLQAYQVTSFQLIRGTEEIHVPYPFSAAKPAVPDSGQQYLDPSPQFYPKPSRDKKAERIDFDDLAASIRY